MMLISLESSNCFHLISVSVLNVYDRFKFVFFFFFFFFFILFVLFWFGLVSFSLINPLHFFFFFFFFLLFLSVASIHYVNRSSFYFAVDVHFSYLYKKKIAFLNKR